MKKLMTHLLVFTLVFQTMGSFMPEARAQGFDPFAASNNAVELDPLVTETDVYGEAGDRECGNFTPKECALAKNAELLAYQREACDDGKGGIEVGVIKEEIEDPETGRQEKMDIDCNAIASLEYKLLEPEVGSDMAFQCVTKNWYMEEQVDFAKEMELPLAKKFCADKIENPKPPKEKAAECAGSLVCNMFKTPLGDAIGFDPISDVIKYAAGNSSFGKGCQDTPGTGCLSTVLWGLFKNIFGNIEGIWDLGKLLVKGVYEGGKWVVKKAAEGVKWVGNKLKDGWNAVSNWWNGTDDAEDMSSAKTDAASTMSDETLDAHVEDSTNAVGSMATGLLTGIFDMIKEGTKDNFMCGGDYYKYEGDFKDDDYGTRKTKQNLAQRGWEEIVNFGADNEPARHDKIRCDQPFIAECASCGQWMNMVCGLVGFLGGEIITAVLTGGAVNAVGKGAKAVGTGAKAVTGAIKSKIGQSAKWQAMMAKGASGMSKLKGVYQGGSKFLGSIPGAKLTTGILKAGGKYSLLLGKTVVGVGKGAGKILLGALKKGKDMALANRLAKGVGAVGKGIGKTRPAKWVKGYFRAMDDAFIYGMQGKKGLQISRMARESSKIQKEIQALQAAADGGDDAARVLIAAQQRKLNILSEHQRLTREAMKATDDAARTRYLDEAKAQANQLEDATRNIAKAQGQRDEAIRLAAQKADDAGDAGKTTVVTRADNGGVSPRNPLDQPTGRTNTDVNPGRSYDDFRETAARTGSRNNDDLVTRNMVSRKPAKVSQRVKDIDPKITSRFDDLKSMKGADGAKMTEVQQSYAKAILNNVENAAQREELVKKIAQDGWDSIRRSCR